MLRHAMENFRSPQVLRFLGRRCLIRGECKTRLEKRREGVCVKHFLQENWIKMYNKQGSVLRIETTINNPRRFKVWRRVTRHGRSTNIWAPLRKGIADFRRRAQICLAANRRYLEALSFAVLRQTAQRTLDPVSKPCIRDGQRYRALRPISPEDSRKLALLQDGRFAIDGIRNRDLQADWPDPVPNDPQGKRTAARITRWLRLLTAHGLLSRVRRTHLYRLTLKGQAVMTCAMPTRKNSLPKIFLSQYVSTNLLYRERAIGFLSVLCVSAVNVCLGPGWLPGEPPEYLMESTELARNGWENLVLRLGLRTGPLRLGALDEVIDFIAAAVRTGQEAGH